MNWGRYILDDISLFMSCLPCIRCRCPAFLASVADLYQVKMMVRTWGICWEKQSFYLVRKIVFIVDNTCVIFTPQPLRAPGYCRHLSGRACGRAAGQTSPINTLTPIIFLGSFSNLARTFITLRSWTSFIIEVLPIKYVHKGPYNEPASFDIPELIFQAKGTKFGI